MRECNCVAHLQERAKQLRPSALSSSELVEALTTYTLHYIEEAAIGQHPHVVDGHDPRMLQRRQNPGLTQDPLAFFDARRGRAQNLERDVAVELAVVCEVYGSMPPSPICSMISYRVARMAGDSISDWR
jgi:hypothetical protein